MADVPPVREGIDQVTTSPLTAVEPADPLTVAVPSVNPAGRSTGTTTLVCVPGPAFDTVTW